MVLPSVGRGHPSQSRKVEGGRILSLSLTVELGHWSSLALGLEPLAFLVLPSCGASLPIMNQLL